MSDSIHVEGLPEGIPQPTWRGKDGRIGWPDIFEYVFSPEEECEARGPVPPLKAHPYKVEVKPGRRDDYDKLCASGILQDAIHRGKAGQIFESPHRRTPQ